MVIVDAPAELLPEKVVSAKKLLLSVRLAPPWTERPAPVKVRSWLFVLNV